MTSWRSVLLKPARYTAQVGIDLKWVDAGGATLDEAFDTEFHFADLVDRVCADPAFSVIAGIDAYGTTRFTAPQVTALLHELETARGRVADPAAALTVGRFLSIVRAAEGAPGTWLEFMGD